jgi:hypothetical protein
MSDVPRVGDLEVHQDLDYQRREWLFERVGWAVMALVVLAALLGLLGRSGPLSRTTAGVPGAFDVRYDRYLRIRSPTTLVVTLSAEATRGDEVGLWISRHYLAGVEIQSVTPEPRRVEAGEERHTFVFPVAERGRPTTVFFHLQAEEPGRLEGELGAAGGSLSFAQLVYP